MEKGRSRVKPVALESKSKIYNPQRAASRVKDYPIRGQNVSPLFKGNQVGTRND